MDTAYLRSVLWTTGDTSEEMHRLPHWVTVRSIQTVAETPTLSRQADKLFSDDERPWLCGAPLR